MSDSESTNESVITVEEAIKEDDREVYRMANEAIGVRFSQIDKPKPLVCPICNGPFVNAIITNCNHFFCESCALKHHRKSTKCFVCEEPTLGIFEYMTKLLIRDPVEPKQMAEEREIARAKKAMVLDMLNETLKMTNGHKIKMVNEKKAVKIAEEVETLLKKAIEKATKARETDIGAFVMLEDAMATMEKYTNKMDEAFDVMRNVYRNV